ncbi:MAG: hypothetical protein PHO48_03000 [Candidatus Gracilibacteria bacterium]|nr:hypothetical protein [Candidatus Gracilibacteria bacterium]MDD5179040.1 hypothetical protein [Candidatus Gracilibacteria bacterium]
MSEALKYSSVEELLTTLASQEEQLENDLHTREVNTGNPDSEDSQKVHDDFYAELVKLRGEALSKIQQLDVFSPEFWSVKPEDAQKGDSLPSPSGDLNFNQKGLFAEAQRKILAEIAQSLGLKEASKRWIKTQYRKGEE